jgi:hypothetical protein
MMRPWQCSFYVQEYCVYLSVCGSRPHILMVMVFGGLVGSVRGWGCSMGWVSKLGIAHVHYQSLKGYPINCCILCASFLYLICQKIYDYNSQLKHFLVLKRDSQESLILIGFKYLFITPPIPQPVFCCKLQQPPPKTTHRHHWYHHVDTPPTSKVLIINSSAPSPMPPPPSHYIIIYQLVVKNPPPSTLSLPKSKYLCQCNHHHHHLDHRGHRGHRGHCCPRRHQHIA